MSAILTSILALISALVPAGANATIAGVNVALIGKIIAAMTDIVPVVMQEYRDLVPIVRNIITALKADPATSADQLAELEAMEAQWDAEFDAAAAAALAEDAGG